jgi:hypothetical protein
MVIVAQLVRAPVCGSGGRRFEPGLSPKAPHFEGLLLLNRVYFGIAFDSTEKNLNYFQMFTLFKSSPKFPVVKPTNIKQAKNYLRKFEESLKNFEEMQNEVVHS